ncbi:hypothetical protein GE061_002022 [Apolygus lucorum]|uniref:Uncharacterized protein n=1 Tax=Apolygus lucorum TaxID=248454 RepID=A0A6A4J9D9_APOLU|nr:hypothetical protein GE061_002022 [Apolygus lucorum]
MPVDNRERFTRKEHGYHQSSSKKIGRRHRKTRFASKHEIIEYTASQLQDDPYGEASTVGKRAGGISKGGGSRRGISEDAISPFTKRQPPKGPGVTFKESADRLMAAFKKMLGEVKEDLKKAEPIPITESRPRDIKMKDISGNLTLSGLKMSGLHEFLINKVQVPTPDELKAGNLWVKYELAVPHLHIAGKYEAEGTHKKIDVRSVGEFSGDVLFYTNIGEVTFMIDDDGALQVDTYKLKIKSLGVDIQEKGLQFGILGSTELKPILDKAVHEHLQKAWKELAAKAALQAKEKLNAVLKRLFKERQEAAIASKGTKSNEEAIRKREEELRKCRERIAHRPDPRPPGYPLSRDQSLLGWLYPPKHPMM